MTISNRKDTSAYLHALNNMRNTRLGTMAHMEGRA